MKKRFGIELNGIEYDAKFVFEYPGYQLEPSEMGAAFGLVQLSNFESVKQRGWKHIQMESIFNNYRQFIRTLVPNPNGK